MVIVCSQAIPKTDPYLVDRMTAIAALKGCDVLICINKDVYKRQARDEGNFLPPRPLDLLGRRGR